MLNPFGGLKKVFKPINKAVKAVGGGVTKAVGSVGRATGLPAPPGFKKKPTQVASKLAPRNPIANTGVTGNRGAGGGFGRPKIDQDY